MPNWDYRKTLTLSGVADATGANHRALQYWSDRLVLTPEPGTMSGGRGVKRRFPIVEIAKAAVIAGVTEIPLSIGEVQNIGMAVDDVFGQYELEPPEKAAKRLADTLKRLDCSLSAGLMRDDKTRRAVEKVAAWEGFIKALHGVKGVKFKLTRNRSGLWRAHFQSKGTWVKRKDNEGPAKLTVSFNSEDAASLFTGILK